MITLPKAAYVWALKHLTREGDTDLFPAPFEIEAIKYNWAPLLEKLIDLDLSTYEWKGGRRFVVPKGKLAFRNATQLDPLDSLILGAIVRKYGNKVEAARISTKERRAFSYRFNPHPTGRFYSQASHWHAFWSTSAERASKPACKWVAISDITDYYNQVYHHVLENTLVDTAGVPKPIVKAILKLLGKLTHGVSRGIPVGPHSVHLLAECALIPIDRSLLSHGYDFCRYVDDVHFFCASRGDAEVALYDFAEIIDKQQRLALQRQKTDIRPAEEFIEFANAMLVDRPLNENEEEIIRIIRKYSNNDLYATVSLDSLSKEDLRAISSETLAELFALYLKAENRNYPRIGWLLRRLSQIGTPAALDYVLQNVNEFTPVLGGVARYIIRASPNYSGTLESAGQFILNALNVPSIHHSEYMQMVLMNLFGKIPALDHVNQLTAMYPNLTPAVRREVVIAAGTADQGHWIKERKDEFANSDPWFRRALICAVPSLPGDEGVHWLRKIRRDMSAMEKLVTAWALKDKSVRPDVISLT
jgi:hypothetical protein